jgi:hypothetical protein
MGKVGMADGGSHIKEHVLVCEDDEFEMGLKTCKVLRFQGCQKSVAAMIGVQTQRHDMGSAYKRQRG